MIFFTGFKYLQIIFKLLFLSVALSRTGTILLVVREITYISKLIILESIRECVKGRWFFPSSQVSSINETDRNDITEILLKVALNTIKPNQQKV